MNSPAGIAVSQRPASASGHRRFLRTAPPPRMQARLVDLPPRLRWLVRSESHSNVVVNDKGSLVQARREFQNLLRQANEPVLYLDSMQAMRDFECTLTEVDGRPRLVDGEFRRLLQLINGRAFAEHVGREQKVIYLANFPHKMYPGLSSRIKHWCLSHMMAAAKRIEYRREEDGDTIHDFVSVMIAGLTNRRTADLAEQEQRQLFVDVLRSLPDGSIAMAGDKENAALRNQIHALAEAGVDDWH